MKVYIYCINLLPFTFMCYDWAPDFQRIWQNSPACLFVFLQTQSLQYNLAIQLVSQICLQLTQLDLLAVTPLQFQFQVSLSSSLKSRINSLP